MTHRFAIACVLVASTAFAQSRGSRPRKSVDMPPPPPGMVKKPLEMPPPPSLKPAKATEANKTAEPASASTDAPVTEPEEIVDAPKPAEPVVEAAKPAVPAAAAPASSGLPKWMFYGSAGATVLAGVGAGYFFATRYELERELRTTLANEPAVGAVNDERINLLVTQANDTGLRANVMLGATAGLAVLSTFTFLGADWSDGKAKVAAVPVISADGTGLAFAGQF